MKKKVVVFETDPGVLEFLKSFFKGRSEYALVKRHTRKSDIFARYGGEEFIMLLPQTSRKGARREAERVREAVSEHSFCTEKTAVSITVSVGVASFPHKKIKNHDDLIHCADTAMFEAKKKGRNMVNIFPAK
ncbi:MAG: GGDEF domain-containing protein [Thermodesulfovibrionales bacterium]|nr:GGDEF domain-containing protein [Thermodesulfovibrionales bacterium]